MGNKFPMGKVYIFFADEDLITQEMVNKSTSRNKSEMPKKTGTPIERMLETIEPVDDVFKTFAWLSHSEAKTKLRADGWDGWT